MALEEACEYLHGVYQYEHAMPYLPLIVSASEFTCARFLCLLVLSSLSCSMT